MIITVEDTGPQVEVVDDAIYITVGDPSILCTLGAEQGPPGAPGTVITIDSSPPVSPAVGDLWIDTS